MRPDILSQFLLREINGLQGVPPHSSLLFLSFADFSGDYLCIDLFHVGVLVANTCALIPQPGYALQSHRVEVLASLYVRPLDTEAEGIDDHLGEVLLDNVGLEHGFLLLEVFGKISSLGKLFDLVNDREHCRRC